MNESRPLAVITGVARRIGRATTLELVRAGFDVIGTVRDVTDPDVRSLREACGTALELLEVDLALPQAASTIADEVERHGRAVAVLVNNASVYEPDPRPGIPDPARAHVTMHVNCAVPVALMARLCDGYLADGACIVNMLDLLAERPWKKYSAYCASKAALLRETLTAARLLAPRVRVVGVSPGMVGPIKPGVADDAEAYLAKVPLGRPGEFDEVARVVRFLAVEGTYITGQVIRVDGGRWLNE